MKYVKYSCGSPPCQECPGITDSERELMYHCTGDFYGAGPLRTCAGECLLVEGPEAAV